ncbi:hypothetical protein GZ78_15590 [Endozoicomonas numazuensis]|uniref:Uncharacterized protein n=1 Tax=Endozoicomonas numazuensis TaxID=1137799 RepID=A0A081NFM5_9GAMM|nr:hypothetical protein GZ78_15590 [Endozoicomonas numazuensis]
MTVPALTRMSPDISMEVTGSENRAMAAAPEIRGTSPIMAPMFDAPIFSTAFTGCPRAGSIRKPVCWRKGARTANLKAFTAVLVADSNQEAMIEANKKFLLRVCPKITSRVSPGLRSP